MMSHPPALIQAIGLSPARQFHIGGVRLLPRDCDRCETAVNGRTGAREWFAVRLYAAARAVRRWIRLLDQLVIDNHELRTGPKTLPDYLTKVAQLGGYLARAGDPPPGNMVMWRGLSRLTDIEMGYLLRSKMGTYDTR
jgi:hypothetical protein